MSSSILQIRMDENLRNQAAALFDRLGLDLPTAVRAFFKKSLAVGGLPFELREENNAGLEALYALNNAAQLNGTAELTEEDIEAEISSYRNGK